MTKVSLRTVLMLALAATVARSGAADDLATEPVRLSSIEATGTEDRPFLDVLSTADDENAVDFRAVNHEVAEEAGGYSFAAAESAPIYNVQDAGEVLDDSTWFNWNVRDSFWNFFDDTKEGSWIAGTEASFVHVRARTGGRITASFSDTTAPGVSTVRFNTGTGLTDNAVGTRLWVGRQITPKWAIVARYYQMSDSTFENAIPFESTGSNFATIEELSRVQAHTIDIELVRSLQLGKWKVDGSFGGRHLLFSAQDQLFAFGVFTTGNFVNLMLQNGSKFEGDGVTFGLTVRRQIGDLPLYAFCSGRGSHIRGESDSFGRSSGTVASSPSAPLVGAATVRRNGAEGHADIGELQTGLQLDYELAKVPAGVFVRMALEYQYWNITAPRTGGAGFGGTIGELTTNSFASAGVGDLQMLGIAVATGINW